MTTTIKVTSHNYPARVTMTNRYHPEGQDPVVVVSTRVLKPEDGEVAFFCTTTQTVEVVDLEPSDPQAK